MAISVCLRLILIEEEWEEVVISSGIRSRVWMWLEF